MSLSARLALWSFASALVLAVAVTTLLALDAERARTAQLRAEGRRIALAAVTLYDVLRLTGSDADRATLQSFLAAAVRGTTKDAKDALAWALVLDDAGNMVAGEVGMPGLDASGVVALQARLPRHVVAVDAAIVARDVGEARAPDVGAGRVLIGLRASASAGSAASAASAASASLTVSALSSLLMASAVALVLFLVVTRRVVRPLAAVAAGMNAVRAGKREQLAPLPGRGDEAAHLIDGFNDMIGALVEGERSRTALERHVGKKVATSIVTEAIGTGTKARVTALFFEIEGFGARMSRDAPEDVVALLQDVVSAVIGIVQEHDGHVEKVLGDAVLAVWGVPPPPRGAAPRAGDEERAVRAALAIVARCKALSEQRRAQRLEPFAVAVGVATGDAMVATVGTDDRAETVVVGEPVILARRIEEEAAALSFGLLVTEETFRALPAGGGRAEAGGFEGAATPPVLIKGVGVPVTLYRVRPRR